MNGLLYFAIKTGKMRNCKMPDSDCYPRNTVNVDIFALYIFSRISRFLNIRENMYTSEITFVIAYTANFT